MREHTELDHFLEMLNRAGVGYGKRIDRDPHGTAVLVEHVDEVGERPPHSTEWDFDAEGKLRGVMFFPMELG